MSRGFGENRFSFFPKFLRSESVVRVAEVAKSCNLDAVNCVIRKGFWVEEQNLHQTLPQFCDTIRKHGLEPGVCTTDFTPEQIKSNPDWLKVISGCGLQNIRIRHFNLPDTGSMSQALETAKNQLAEIAGLCLKHHVRVLLQVHHFKLIQSATAAWYVVRDLPPEAVGVELDPGNQSFEGMENWDYSAGLLGKHLTALGVKDTRMEWDEGQAGGGAFHKGWKRKWASCRHGEINWEKVFRPLAKSGFNGPLVFMPFYHDNNPTALIDTLKDEVEYIRQVIKGIK